MNIYLEIGSKRTFACALDWPGWSRSGRNAEAAVEALAAYQQRYTKVMRAAKIAFDAPDKPSFKVIEELTGDATTDFGAPGKVPQCDARPVDNDELAHLQAILQACWAAFDRAVKAAHGKELRKGPRGGGRDLDKIVEHVLGAEANYLSYLPAKHKIDETVDISVAFKRERQAAFEGLAAAVRGELPPRMPRGGAVWPPRYFVRRAAWHVLDHAWEIEDRAI